MTPAPAKAHGKMVPRRVMVVDDNVDAAETLALVLRMLGSEVRVAHAGPAALDLADGFPPDVVFLDLGLPGMDGYEVARQFRARPTTATARLVALTGYGQPEDKARSHLAGFEQHLVKPVAPEALRSLLAENGRRPGRGPLDPSIPHFDADRQPVGKD